MPASYSLKNTEHFFVKCSVFSLYNVGNLC